MSSTASMPLTGGHSSIWISGLAIIVALVIGVGFASHTVLHHIVQTLPLWVPAALRRRAWTKWFALPCFLLWLIIMVAIWLFLLHLPTFVSGHFSLVEIAMTIVVGVASGVGIAAAIRTRGVRFGPAFAAFVLGAVAQFACFRLSQIPFIWRH